MAVALVQGWPDWTLLTLTFAVVASGQFLEGNVLSPNLVGASVGLHPVWIMFSLLAFGTLFGFTGLMVAVPVAAACGVWPVSCCESTSSARSTQANRWSNPSTRRRRAW